VRCRLSLQSKRNTDVLSLRQPHVGFWAHVRRYVGHRIVLAECHAVTSPSSLSSSSSAFSSINSSSSLPVVHCCVRYNTRLYEVPRSQHTCWLPGTVTLLVNCSFSSLFTFHSRRQPPCSRVMVGLHTYGGFSDERIDLSPVPDKPMKPMHRCCTFILLPYTISWQFWASVFMTSRARTNAERISAIEINWLLTRTLNRLFVNIMNVIILLSLISQTADGQTDRQTERYMPWRHYRPVKICSAALNKDQGCCPWPWSLVLGCP